MPKRFYAIILTCGLVGSSFWAQNPNSMSLAIPPVGPTISGTRALDITPLGMGPIIDPLSMGPIIDPLSMGGH